MDEQNGIFSWLVFGGDRDGANVRWPLEIERLPLFWKIQESDKDNEVGF